jgi:hypothetical protein
VSFWRQPKRQSHFPERFVVLGEATSIDRQPNPDDNAMRVVTTEPIAN